MSAAHCLVSGFTPSLWRQVPGARLSAVTLLCVNQCAWTVRHMWGAIPTGEAWADEVQKLALLDDSGRPLGHLYLDLYARCASSRHLVA